MPPVRRANIGQPRQELLTLQISVTPRFHSDEQHQNSRERDRHDHETEGQRPINTAAVEPRRNTMVSTTNGVACVSSIPAAHSQVQTRILIR